MARRPSSSAPLIALRGVALGFGGAPLVEAADIALQPGARACLVGRNGSGKSTVLKALAGKIALDAGDRYVSPGLKIGYLPQEPRLPPGVTVTEHIGGASADTPVEAHVVREILMRLDLDGCRPLNELSGGEARRASLARALVGDPDVLLLDEPTNHLDLPTILWLENSLLGMHATMLLISHDQAFLRATTDRIFWVHRGGVLSHPRGYGAFTSWAEQVHTTEDNARAKLTQHLKAESRWLNRGITARRRRNQGRLAKLERLRAARRALIGSDAKAALNATTARQSGRLVIEAENISKTFESQVVIRDFSTRIQRGDRVGLIGPNGAGKTTLLHLLIGRLTPDAGIVRHGTQLDIAVFDQRREALDPDETLWRTLVPAGGDSLLVQGRMRHVVGYLRDFLFHERQAQSPVRTLSGGERNRLLLAKILARPSNLLVLDEPTNDLDADTLGLLQDMLDDYAGTLLLVSHDRDFLDGVVHSTIALEGNGVVREYAGGYKDYEKQRPGPTQQRPVAPRQTTASRRAANGHSRRKALSYHEVRELDALPVRIAALEVAKDKLEGTLADTDLFVRDRARHQELAEKLTEVTLALSAAEDRWLELEERRTGGATEGTPHK